MSSTKREDGAFLMISKGVITTILITLICILVFALVVKLACLNSSVIKWVNQFLKIFSLFIGVFFSIKGKLGFVKGGVVGIVSTLITFLLFALISGQTVGVATFFIEVVFSLIIGAVFGIIAVNRKSQD